MEKNWGDTPSATLINNLWHVGLKIMEELFTLENTFHSGNAISFHEYIFISASLSSNKCLLSYVQHQCLSSSFITHS